MIHPNNQYSKVWVDHKKQMNILSKTASETFAALNSDVKSGVSSQCNYGGNKKKGEERGNNNNTETCKSVTPSIFGYILT